MKKRRNHDAGFKARVALEAVKGERTVSELTAEYGVHPTMIHQWMKSLLDGAADIFERGGRRRPEIMNTNQGSQFTSCAWTDRLKSVGTRISTDSKRRCIDNIFIERPWRPLNYECVYLHAWETRSQARVGIERWRF